MTTIAPVRSAVLWLPFVPYIVVSAVHVGALWFSNDAVAAPTKLALMPLLAIAVILNSRNLSRTAALTLLLVAIGFSWLGDGAGTFVPFLPTLPMMLLFFGIAHLAYIVLFTRHVAIRRLGWGSVIFAVWWIAMIAALGPHTGGLFFAVAAYGIVLGATAATATRANSVVLWGGVFFLISDTILAFRLFLSESMPHWTSPAVMLTYTLGQGLIAYGVMMHLRKNTR